MDIAQAYINILLYRFIRFKITIYGFNNTISKLPSYIHITLLYPTRLTRSVDHTQTKVGHSKRHFPSRIKELRLIEKHQGERLLINSIVALTSDTILT